MIVKVTHLGLFHVSMAAVLCDSYKEERLVCLISLPVFWGVSRLKGRAWIWTKQDKSVYEKSVMMGKGFWDKNDHCFVLMDGERSGTYEIRGHQVDTGTVGQNAFSWYNHWLKEMVRRVQTSRERERISHWWGKNLATQKSTYLTYLDGMERTYDWWCQVKALSIFRGTSWLTSTKRVPNLTSASSLCEWEKKIFQKMIRCTFAQYRRKLWVHLQRWLHAFLGALY